jgi:DNA-binding NtrC family response regulator
MASEHDGLPPTDVLIVEDSVSMAGLLRGILEKAGYSVDHVVEGHKAIERMNHAPPPVMILDLGLPDITGHEVIEAVEHCHGVTEIIVVTGESSLTNAVEVMRAGASDFLVKPVNKERLLASVANALENRVIRAEVQRAGQKLPKNRFHGFVGHSPIMQPVYQLIRNVATSKATVFVTGESGTGKEVAAEALHKESNRAARPFLALNCGAIPKDLLESELFGHVKGAFTGATADREGAAGKAHTGTLFLDEICEMPLEMQVKLLRFTQTSTYQKLGSAQTKHADVRLICATNRDPLEEVKAGRFREDLYYRLYVVPLEIPPLRDRGEDVIEIARSFLSSFASEEGRQFKDFAPETLKLLSLYSWPGNVRQLQNVIRNVVVLHDGPLVTPEMLPAPLLAPGDMGMRSTFHETPSPDISEEPAQDDAIRPLWLVEKLAIERAVNICGGNIQEAAKRLDISPSTIYRKKAGWIERGLEVDPRLLHA